MAVSIIASEEGLKIIDRARRKKGWKKYEEAWFETATTSRATLKRFWLKQPVLQPTFILICKEVGITDWQSIVVPSPAVNRLPPALSVYNPETWVGRLQIINNLKLKLQDKTRIVWITGIPGIGKTTLGECLASYVWESNPTFQWIYLEVLEGQSTNFTTVAADLLAKLGDGNIDSQERNDPKQLTDRLIRKLQSSFYWLQLDSLERLLDSARGNEFADANWVKFLWRCLTEQEFASRLVLTSQALPSALVEFTDRYSNVWQVMTLVGLSADAKHNEHLEFFGKHGVVVDDGNQDTLSKLGQVYEGHTLVLQVMSGEIHADFGGDVDRYWAVNHQEFEQVARSLESKRLDETEYNDELDRRVRDRVKKSLQQLPTDAQDLLFRSSVYRRPVPKKFWLAMIDDRPSIQQKEAYRVLCDRALVEIEREPLHKDSFLVRQHNLIRDITYDIIKSKSVLWNDSERRAANLWLTAFNPLSKKEKKIESLRNYIEAFNHYCQIQEWLNANEILIEEDILKYLYLWGYFRETIQICKFISREIPDAIYEQYIGDSYLYLSEYFEATKYYEIVLNYAQYSENKRYEGYAFFGLAQSSRFSGKYLQAIKYYNRQLDIARESLDSQLEACALGGIGDTYWFLSDYPQATNSYRKQLKISRKIGDKRLEGGALGGLGDTFQALGNNLRSVYYHKKSLAIVRELGERQRESYVLCGLGDDYWMSGNYEEAIKFYQKSLNIARETGSLQRECAALCGLGISYDKLKKYSEAINYHSEYFEMSCRIECKRGEANSLVNFARSLIAIEDYIQAYQKLDRSLKIFKDLGVRAGESEVLLRLAEIYFKKNEFKLAYDFCSQSLKIANEIAIPLAKECRQLILVILYHCGISKNILPTGAL